MRRRRAAWRMAKSTSSSPTSSPRRPSKTRWVLLRCRYYFLNCYWKLPCNRSGVRQLLSFQFIIVKSLDGMALSMSMSISRVLHLLFYIFVLFLYVDTFLDNRSTTKCYIQNITQTSLKPDI